MSPVLAVLRVFVHYWGRHRLQALLGLAGIAAGVAVFTSIRLANSSALESFAVGMEVLSGRATHRVFSPAGEPVPEGLFPRLNALPAVRAATPSLQGRLFIEPREGGTPLPVTVYGVDPISGQDFHRFRVSPEDGAGRTRPLELFLATPGGLALSRPLAERLGLRAGMAVRARAGGTWRELQLLAVFDPPAGQRERLRDAALADIATFQETFGRLGRLDAIELRLAPGGERAVEALLPPGLALEPAGSRAERVARMAEAFQLNLDALGLFALLVAVFLIFNAATFSVVQRSETIAFLRCMGAGRGAIFAALLVENVALGAVGGLAGVWLGRQLALVMVRFTGATLYEVILEAQVEAIPLAGDWRLWPVGVLLGAGVAGLGVLAPAAEGARISPLTAVRASRADGASAFGLGLLAVGGLGLLGLAALLSFAPWQSAAGGLAAATAVALGGALLCPLVVAGVGRAVTPLLAIAAGPVGRLAGRSVGRSLGRSGVAAAALMVALSLALAIEITVTSFRGTFQLWMEQALNADIYVDTPAAGGDAVLSPALLAALRTQGWVRELAPLRSRRVVLGAREVRVLAVNPEQFTRITRVVAGSARARARNTLQEGGVLVSETLAYPLGLREGGVLTLPTATGARRFSVGAVVRNFSVPSGVVYLGEKTYAAAYGEEPVRRVAIWLTEPKAPARAMEAITALPSGAELELKSNAGLRKEALHVFDRTFAVADLMGALAALIAFLAVFSALTALLEERIRLVGYMRAIGVSRRVVAVSMALEACLLAVTATVVSWGAGLVMSAILVFIVNRRAFGWTLLFRPESGSYLPLLGLAVGAALLGSLYPIVRASRLSVVATIREE